MDNSGKTLAPQCDSMVSSSAVQGAVLLLKEQRGRDKDCDRNLTK
jgi:hypothetical protein